MHKHLQGLLQISLFLTIFGSFLFACSKENKIRQLPLSLQQLIDSNKLFCGCLPYVDEYIWRSKTTYVSSCRGPACDCIVLYYDETGNQIKFDSTYRFDNFLSEAKRVKTIWSCQL